MDNYRILIVEDDPLGNEFLVETLQRGPYEIDSVDSAEKAMNRINENEYHLVVTDIRLPDKNGMEVLNVTKKKSDDIGVIMITAYGTVENAVEAMKIGAFDYVTKPFTPDRIEMTIKRYFDFNRIMNENKMLRSQLGKMYGIKNIIGNSKKMQQVFDIIQMVADSKSTVLIQGASGTGKELVAKAIYYNSPRRDKPFIKTNCASLPDGLVESELFGHEKGAFTGAIRQTRGRFELANGGTLLLDEIGEMSPHLQAKLLRVLQEKSFEKVGNPETVEVDVRIIATTNRDLDQEVNDGKFREDLYYRLNVVPINLPPLKERKEDIPLLVKHFIKKSAEENAKSVHNISEAALQMLMNYDWPGNVRELENAIERSVVICRNEVIKPQHFLTFYDFQNSQDGFNHQKKEVKNLAEIERRVILQVLQEHNGNRTKASEVLGISVRTLRNKIKEYRELGLTIPE